MNARDSTHNPRRAIPSHTVVAAHPGFNVRLFAHDTRAWGEPLPVIAWRIFESTDELSPVPITVPPVFDGELAVICDSSTGLAWDAPGDHEPRPVHDMLALMTPRSAQRVS